MEKVPKFRIFGHPAHAVFTHFPLALLTTASLWDLLALLRPQESFWWDLAFMTMLAGLAFSLPAGVTGLLDLLAIPANDPAMTTGIRHMGLMITAILFYGISASMRELGETKPSLTVLLLSFAGAAVLSIGGWFGGELVYGHKDAAGSKK